MEKEKIDIEKISRHWIEMSDKDFETMMNLFRSGDYHWSLFMGHLVLERLLKALIVRETNNHAPFSHDLRRLSKFAGLPISEEHNNWLDTISAFNINTRYDDYKKDFYNKCNKEFTNSWISNIQQIRAWIKTKL